jgi:hypothetical protein
METSLKSAVNAVGGLSWNQKKLLNKIASENPKVYVLAADDSYNSTTPATASEFTFAIAKRRKYYVEGFIHCLADGTSGIAANLATTNDPSDARVHFAYSIDNAADQTEIQTDLTSPNPTGVAAAITAIKFSGHIWAGDNDDTCNVQFSTNTGTTAAAVYKGSFVKVYEAE